MRSHILVTGAAGLLGQQVCRTLQSHGHDVLAFIREGERAPDQTPHVRGDATEPGDAQRAVAGLRARATGGPTGLVHLAAIPAPIGPPEQVFSNNTSATHTMLEAAGREGLERVVTASSISALGFAFGREQLRPLYVPVDEEHPTLAEDPYALSKVVDEVTAQMMARRWGMTVVALRFPFIGHGDRLDARLQQAREDPQALARELWAWIHTEDAAEAVHAALKAPISGAATINVAAQDTISEQPTRDLLARYLPDVPVRARVTGRETLFDLDRARTHLDFVARHGWHEEVLPAPTT